MPRKKKPAVEKAWNELLNDPELQGSIPYHSNFNNHPHQDLIRTLIVDDLHENNIDINGFFSGRGRATKAHTEMQTNTIIRILASMKDSNLQYVDIDLTMEDPKWHPIPEKRHFAITKNKIQNVRDCQVRAVAKGEAKKRKASSSTAAAATSTSSFSEVSSALSTAPKTVVMTGRFSPRSLQLMKESRARERDLNRGIVDLTNEATNQDWISKCNNEIIELTKNGIAVAEKEAQKESDFQELIARNSGVAWTITDASNNKGPKKKPQNS